MHLARCMPDLLMHQQSFIQFLTFDLDLGLWKSFHTFVDQMSFPRIRVRIDPPHPLVCRKRRLNGAVLRMRPEKPRSRVTAGVAR
jgi:hypothetical protein